jgi:hypothetical protein
LRSNTGLTNTNVRALALDPLTPSRLYAGTGSGVFEIEQFDACVGDCSGTHTVGVNDVITLLDIALGKAQPAACSDGGLPLGGEVDIAVIIQAVNNALSGCRSTDLYVSTSGALRGDCSVPNP